MNISEEKVGNKKNNHDDDKHHKANGVHIFFHKKQSKFKRFSNSYFEVPKVRLIFASASPKQPAPENPPGWERSKGNRL